MTLFLALTTEGAGCLNNLPRSHERGQQLDLNLGPSGFQIQAFGSCLRWYTVHRDPTSPQSLPGTTPQIYTGKLILFPQTCTWALGLTLPPFGPSPILPGSHQVLVILPLGSLACPQLPLTSIPRLLLHFWLHFCCYDNRTASNWVSPLSSLASPQPMAARGVSFSLGHESDLVGSSLPVQHLLDTVEQQEGPRTKTWRFKV